MSSILSEGRKNVKMEKELIALKILYNPESRIVYSLYAELFRLVGIYVGEDCLQDYSLEVRQADEKSYQLFLCIGKNKNDIFRNRSICVVEISENDYLGLSLQNGLDYEEKIKNTLIDMNRVFFAEDHSDKKKIYSVFELLYKEILHIYLEANIFKGACLLQFYRMKDSLHEESEKIFVTGLESLLNKDQVIQKRKRCFPEVQKHIEYSIIYCAQKVNLSRYFQVNKELVFPLKFLAKTCKAAIKREPDFSNQYVLLGMICERSKEYAIEAIEAYLMALTKIGNEPYSSHILYWLTVLYQKNEVRSEDAKHAIERACNYRHKYRNLYKLGSVYVNEENYVEAVKKYKECLEELDTQKNGMWDPLEIEYYYKTSVVVCWYNITTLKDYDEGISYGEKAIDFYNKVFKNEELGAYNYYFGDEAEIYREKSKQRIDLKKLYSVLAVGYREKGDIVKADEYWKLSMNGIKE